MQRLQRIDFFCTFARFFQRNKTNMRQLKIQKSITNRSSEALDKYLVEIGRQPLVTIDEEIELAQAIRKGGPEGERAKERLVTANLRFVVSVAKQYQHQ